MLSAPLAEISAAATFSPVQDRPLLLLVDDEVKVLEGLSLHLRRHFRVMQATSGQAALAIIDGGTTPAVVISDMRMPEMDGAALLSRIRERLPDTMRILLTGHSDLEAAIAAVNHGQLFRFLTKPCPPPTLLAAVNAAIEQHRLVTSERVLLKQTLAGSIRAMMDALGLANPLAFGRANRIQSKVMALASAAGVSDWHIEVAAMVSQLGCVIVPPALLERQHEGGLVTSEELQLLERVPTVSAQLIESIPRLEAVRAILLQQTLRFDGRGTPPQGPRGESIALGARMLRLALDQDELESRGLTPGLALETMGGRAGLYDPQLLRQLNELHGRVVTRQAQEISLAGLMTGMTLCQDVRSRSGMLLVARGHEVTHGLLHRLRNFPAGTVREPLQILVPEDQAKA